MNSTMTRINQRVICLLLIIMVAFAVVGCNKSQKVEKEAQEFELLTFYIEIRNDVNKYGRLTGYVEEYIHYAYVNENGEIIFDEIRLLEVETRKTEIDESPKLIIDDGIIFVLSEEMYINAYCK